MHTLSKSDFTLAKDCVTKLYYRERQYPTATSDDPYLALLAQGGYMVEHLAKALFPEGRELPHAKNHEGWEATREALAADEVTLFEATLLHGRLLARVDVLVKRGNTFDLIEVKSTSINGDDVRERLEGGAPTPFRAKRKPWGIITAWQPYLEDVTYQQLVLSRCFPGAIIRPWLIVVDTDASTDIDGLWSQFELRRNVPTASGRVRDLEVRFVGDAEAFRRSHFLVKLDCAEEVEALLPAVTEEADRFAALLTDAGPVREQRSIDWQCKQCEFRVDRSVTPNGFGECWGPLADPPPEIFDIVSFGTVKHDGELLANHLIASRRTRLTDVDRALLTKKDGTTGTTNQRQLRQLSHTLAGSTFVGDGLGAALSAWRYPLHFIDFETSGLAVPYHAGMRPYETVAFQWSCHTIDAPGAAPRHSEWLNTVDAYPNESFARSLRDAIGDAGTVLMWATHERTTLRAIAEQLTRYGRGDAALLDWLAELTADGGRLVDMNALCTAEFFHPAMKGRTSIKRVLDAIWKHDAETRARCAEWTGREADETDPYLALPRVRVGDTELEVVDGTGAMTAYQEMLYGASRADVERHQAWQRLLRQYCELDTLAMVLIWDHWRRVAGAA
jgi:hypothetical protein